MSTKGSQSEQLLAFSIASKGLLTSNNYMRASMVLLPKFIIQVFSMVI